MDTTPAAAVAATPLTLSLTSFLRPGSYPPERFRRCRASRSEAKRLSARLFAEQAALRSAGVGHRRLDENLRVACYDEAGRFDHAVCALRFDPESGRYLIRSSFYRRDRLVAIIDQPGRLVPEPRSGGIAE
jgi:hypothetical protein